MRITVKQTSMILGCSQQFIRIGLQRKQLDIGEAVKMSTRWTYYINPVKLANKVGLTVKELEGEINGLERSTK